MSGRPIARAFAEIYAPVCSAAAALLERAAALGVSIYRSARLADLEQASHTHEVLILVAHWRGSLVREHDLREDVNDCISAPSPGSPLALLAEELRPLMARLPQGSAAPDLRIPVARAMNQLIRSGRLTPFFPGTFAEAGEIEMHPLIVETLSRDLLDAWLGESVHPGNQLELADGLHPVAAVSDAIAVHFQGTLDLSCCTSSVLGTYLQLERGDTIDIIMGDHFVVPAPQLALLDSTFELVGEQPSLDYAAARRSVARGLDDWQKRRKNG